MFGSSSPKPIVVVCGATGRQGSSVIRFLLKDGTYAVRGLTRTADCPKALELAKQGVEIRAADFENVETVKEAFKGAYAVFGMTNFWEPGVGDEGERRQGRNLADAAKAENIQHFIFSTLDHSPLKLAQCEAKADVSDYLRESGVPSTQLVTSFFMENTLQVGPFLIDRTGEDTYEMAWGLATDYPVACHASADIGGWVLAILKDRDQWIGKDVKIASQFITPRDMGRVFEEVTGKRCIVRRVTAAEVQANKDAATDFLALQLCLNALWFVQNPGPPARDLETSYTLYPEAMDYRAFVKENLDGFLALPIGAKGEQANQGKSVYKTEDGPKELPKVEANGQKPTSPKRKSTLRNWWSRFSPIH